MRKYSPLILSACIICAFPEIGKGVEYSPPFKLVEGNKYPICREIEHLLRHGINKPYVYDISTSEVGIPHGKEYDQFKTPKWEPSSINELLEYLSDETLESLRKAARASYRIFELDVDKVQKSILDYDRDGISDTLIRFTYKGSESFWTIYLADRSNKEFLRFNNYGHFGSMHVILVNGISYIFENTVFGGSDVIFINSSDVAKTSADIELNLPPVKSKCVYRYPRSFVHDYVVRVQTKDQ